MPQVQSPVRAGLRKTDDSRSGALLSGYALAADRSGSWLHIVCFVLVIVSRRWSTSGSECNSRAARYRGW